MQTYNESLPEIYPQKTNVLTGAQTTYYSGKEQAWRSEYTDLITFQNKQKHRVKAQPKDILFRSTKLKYG